MKIRGPRGLVCCLYVRRAELGKEGRITEGPIVIECLIDDVPCVDLTLVVAHNLLNVILHGM